MSSRTRGTFDWESIKGDKFKDHFLGQSSKLQSSWYLNRDEDPKDPSASGGPDEEMIRAIQAQEEEYMQEALGLRKKRRRSEGVSLERSEVEELLHRDEEDAKSASLEDSAEYVAGLGYDERPIVEHLEEKDLLPVSIRYLGPELPPSFRRRESSSCVKDAKDDEKASDEEEKSHRKRTKHHRHHHHRHHHHRRHDDVGSGEEKEDMFGDRERRKKRKKEGKEGKKKLKRTRNIVKSTD
jgi:hypothetical protein